MKTVLLFLTLFYANNVFASCDFNQQYERVALVIGNSDYDYDYITT